MVKSDKNLQQMLMQNTRPNIYHPFITNPQAQYTLPLPANPFLPKATNKVCMPLTQSQIPFPLAPIPYHTPAPYTTPSQASFGTVAGYATDIGAQSTLEMPFTEGSVNGQYPDVRTAEPDWKLLAAEATLNAPSEFELELESLFGNGPMDEDFNRAYEMLDKIFKFKEEPRPENSLAFREILSMTATYQEQKHASTFAV
jgi:hypothetical protein